MRTAGVVAIVLLVLGIAGAAFSGVSFDLVYAVGEFGIGRESFDSPVDVVEDRDENIFVVDRRNNRIQVLDRRGRFVREWGKRGFSPGAFDVPSAITIDPITGNLLVVDRQNHRVQIFDPEGNLAKVGSNGKALTNPLGRLGSGNGDFNNPMDVAVDKRGNIYVADTGNNRIQKFDPSGAFLAEWGKFARRRGTQLNNPVSVAYSDEGFGYVYVLNSPDCRVLKFDIDGNFVKEWPMHRKGDGALCGPSRIRIEPRRYTVYIADTDNNRVILFDKEGEFLGDLREGKAPFKKPSGIFVTQTFGENVLVADTGNNLIQKFRRVR
ncbi:MAG: 6-bladed beta-propeller [Deltaproteobacteria bacterium]|nr:6-bladed beta-propeller [Deltaproteobacteria bacterium]